MKLPNILFALLAVCIVALAGCKKSEQSGAPNTEYYGVKVDWPKLDTEFANADPELQRAASLTVRHIRYMQFADALKDLEAISAAPKLTEAQKKLIGDLTAQTKQAITKAPPQ